MLCSHPSTRTIPSWGEATTIEPLFPSMEKPKYPHPIAIHHPEDPADPTAREDR